MFKNFNLKRHRYVFVMLQNNKFNTVKIALGTIFPEAFVLILFITLKFLIKNLNLKKFLKIVLHNEEGIIKFGKTLNGGTSF